MPPVCAERISEANAERLLPLGHVGPDLTIIVVIVAIESGRCGVGATLIVITTGSLYLCI